MHLLKYGPGFTRRHFLETMGAGYTAGVLAPLSKVIAAEGDVTKAYPDELLTIDGLTKGKYKAGDMLDANSVDDFIDYLDPIAYIQIKQQGRVCKLQDATTDIYRLNPKAYIDATLSNQGRARFDEKGNVVTEKGEPWVGGNPFPAATTAVEVAVAQALSWGRYDVAHQCIWEYDLDGSGKELYNYKLLWIEEMATGRLATEPMPYRPTQKDKLRNNTVLFIQPQDVKGTSVLTVWPYDQTQLPDFFGYLPAFKRVRRFPSNQRFEPVIAGSQFYISDAWGMGDPYLTWGNFKLIGRQPFLGFASNNWAGSDPNWIHGRCGGANGQKFLKTNADLIPEVFIVDLEPTGYPRAPYSKKRLWFDARTMVMLTMVAYDRRGEVYKQYEVQTSLYEDDKGNKFSIGAQDPHWSWTGVHFHNVQTDWVTLMDHAKTIPGGYTEKINDPSIYEEFCTLKALNRLGT